MRPLFGLLSLVVVLAIALGGYYFYLKHAQPAGTGINPQQTISLMGVQNDLLAIAQAERAYFALHGSYASLGELTSSGALTVSRSGRDGYEYRVETTANGFLAIARHYRQPGASPSLRYPTITVDQTMQIHQSD
jgi:hypothetical protein